MSQRNPILNQRAQDIESALRARVSPTHVQNDPERAASLPPYAQAGSSFVRAMTSNKLQVHPGFTLAMATMGASLSHRIIEALLNGATSDAGTPIDWRKEARGLLDSTRISHADFAARLKFSEPSVKSESWCDLMEATLLQSPEVKENES